MESGIWKGKNFTNYPLSKKNPSIKTQTRSKSNNKFYDVHNKKGKIARTRRAQILALSCV